MNLPLVLFFCQIVIVSWAHYNLDSFDRTDDDADPNGRDSVTRSSKSHTPKKITKFSGQNMDSSKLEILPFIPVVTELIEDIAHVIKTQIKNMLAPLEDSTAGNNAFINQTTTECRSRSSTSSGRRNCVTKGLTVGGMSTIFVLLAVSLGVKIAELVKELSGIAPEPPEYVVHHSSPFNNQFSESPPHIKPFNHIYPINGPPISPELSRVYRTTELYIASTVNPMTSNVSRELYNMKYATPLDTFRPVRRFRRSDEVLYDHDQE